jgi:hypothetical protein
MTIKKKSPYISMITFSSSGGGGGGGISGSIANTQVAFGTAANTIGGEPDFTYDSTINLLTTEKVRTQVVVDVRNETGSTIGAGSVVYVNGDGTLIDLANASDSAKMPSIGIVTNNLGDNQNGYAAISGQVNGLDGSAGNTVFDSTIVVADVGKILYVSPINAGRLTITKPTSSTHLIQNVGRILDLTGPNVKIVVNNIGRTNDVPNYSFATVTDTCHRHHHRHAEQPLFSGWFRYFNYRQRCRLNGRNRCHRNYLGN